MKKFALTVTLLGLWAIKAVHAAEFFCSSGDVTCLIRAINKANQNGEENTINLAAGTYTLTSLDNSPSSNSGNGLPRIVSAMIINGESAETTIIERDSGAPAFRILDVDASGRLTLNGLTVRGGGPGPPGPPPLVGGGINNDGTLTITDSIIERNGAGVSGGGIANRGDLTLLRSIVTRNFAGPFFGAGIYNIGTATIISSSITRNALQGTGGGIANGDTLSGTVGAMTIHNSTISENLYAIFNPGAMIITNSTIANNLTEIGQPFLTAGIRNSGVLHIGNSTISGNRGRVNFQATVSSNISNSGILGLQNTIVEQCSGPLTSLGNNIIGDLTEPFSED
jgi:hypothetical protein